MQCQGKVSGALVKVPFINFELGLILLPSANLNRFRPVSTPYFLHSRFYTQYRHQATPEGPRQLSFHVSYYMTEHFYLGIK